VPAGSTRSIEQRTSCRDRSAHLVAGGAAASSGRCVRIAAASRARAMRTRCSVPNSEPKRRIRVCTIGFVATAARRCSRPRRLGEPGAPAQPDGVVRAAGAS